MHRINKNSNTFFFLFFISFILFIIFNLFFYSIISIGLYKFICYEKQSDLLKIIIFNKFTYIFFNNLNSINIDLINLDFFYRVNIQNSFLSLFSNNFFFYDFLPKVNIRYFFYLKDNFFFGSSKDLNLIFLNFYIRSSNLNWIQSISLQKTIIINFNESSLFFFRIYNPSHFYVKLITLYMVYPSFLTLYVNKIQCFCFNTIFLYPLELVDLPVLVYIYPFLSSNFYFLNNIIIYYIIFLN